MDVILQDLEIDAVLAHESVGASRLAMVNREERGRRPNDGAQEPKRCGTKHIRNRQTRESTARQNKHHGEDVQHRKPGALLRHVIATPMLGCGHWRGGDPSQTQEGRPADSEDGGARVHEAIRGSSRCGHRLATGGCEWRRGKERKPRWGVKRRKDELVG